MFYSWINQFCHSENEVETPETAGGGCGQKAEEVMISGLVQAQ